MISSRKVRCPMERRSWFTLIVLAVCLVALSGPPVQRANEVIDFGVNQYYPGPPLTIMPNPDDIPISAMPSSIAFTGSYPSKQVKIWGSVHWTMQPTWYGTTKLWAPRATITLYTQTLNHTWRVVTVEPPEGYPRGL